MQVKGGVLHARKSMVEKEFGVGAWERILAALPEEHRRTLERGIFKVSWYPLELSRAVDDAIVKIFGRGDRHYFEELGAASARANLTTVHRELLAPGEPQLFLRRAPTVYRFYYDVGRREYEATGPTSGVLTTYDAETFSEPDCLTVIGWYRVALEMCGAKEVKIRETACRAKGGPHCRYELKWTM